MFNRLSWFTTAITIGCAIAVVAAFIPYLHWLVGIPIVALASAVVAFILARSKKAFAALLAALLAIVLFVALGIFRFWLITGHTTIFS